MRSGAPVAVVDGNGERVLERLDGVKRSGEPVWARAQNLLAPKAAGDWNQAMMELGATICTPIAPSCLICPLQQWCKLPGHDVRKAQPARNKRQLICGLSLRRDSVYLVQRDRDESLMASMWELPQLDSLPDNGVLARLKHSITNSDYSIVVVSVESRKVPKGGKWVASAELSRIPLTGIARKALRRAGLM